MANPFIDRLTDLECVERNGVVRTLTRQALVLGLEDTSYTVLWSALAKAGIPAHGSALTGPTANTKAFSALVLVERAAKIVEQDRAVTVTLRYEHKLDGPYQKLIAPAAPGVLFVKGRSGIVQKPTNFFYPYGRQNTITAGVTDAVDGLSGDILITAPGHGLRTGDTVVLSGITGTVEANGTWVVIVLDDDHYLINTPFVNAYVAGGTSVADGTRIQIFVSHTFPTNGRLERTRPGECVIQGGEINLPFPQDTVRLQGYLNTGDPFSLKAGIHRKLNLVAWCGQPARTWLCTEVEFDILNPNPGGDAPVAPLYRFEFEFQHDDDGWDPTVVFKDERTGLPPNNVIAASRYDEQGVLRERPWGPNTTIPGPAPLPAGVWTVPALAAIDFNGFFAATFA